MEASRFMVKGNNYAHGGRNHGHSTPRNKKPPLRAAAGTGASVGASHQGIHFALDGFALARLVVLHAVLVAHDLAVHLVDEIVHGRVQVGV